jgi:hypothetical protein
MLSQKGLEVYAFKEGQIYEMIKRMFVPYQAFQMKVGIVHEVKSWEITYAGNIGGLELLVCELVIFYDVKTGFVEYTNNIGAFSGGIKDCMWELLNSSLKVKS